ncbi:hypothetical protein A1O3_00890 [Capronia epimyces CBS 606.96]|uniref:PQ loop repeat protein n=1 Tax=Capronia epimyces CBS 606.96 TaxID=1182542 RepID=W9YRT5_9EURO|nr:uncharacterized protein A1O3_00890 [Capronia epimyces CBS 606.96]EXJ92340.1 hypothetical protein A1O3_00890 [Capronia epimyces CBS 606.96]
MDARCEEIARVSYTNFGLSLFILVGILVSYLPQHIRIIRLRSSFGLSPYFVLLGATSGTCAFANILVLPRSRADIACCRVVDQFACLAGLLGIAQVGVQWSCFTVILLLFLIFFPRPNTPAEIEAETESSPDTDSLKVGELGPSYRTALLVTGVAVLHAAIIAILSFYFVYARPSHAQGWANFLGIFSTVLASIQYFPQIYTTYMLKRVGSLSIPMMCIQTPGSFVWAASLAARLGSEGWSAWGVYVVTGCLQGTLLVMGSYFEIMHHKRERKELQARMAHSNGSMESQTEADPDPPPYVSEETPLLLRSED